MIADALKLIQVSLQNYIKDVEDSQESSQDIVVLDNVAMAEQLGGNRDDLNERVIITLFNIEEEATLKNTPHYRIENGRTVYQNPPVSLNLYVLFSVLHYSHYETALRRLARVIEFFQWKKELSILVSSRPGGELQEIRVLPDLYTLTFDQLNHLWGSLGGKQVPFVMYRTRLVQLDAQKRQAEAHPIKERVLE
ncbi:DUF4255 domain-containing protein [filamentous cyanobacterium CCP3]|nr:DUF4255 domain-containing protein [filamentous cyanobacterium CCP3]